MLIKLVVSPSTYLTSSSLARYVLTIFSLAKILPFAPSSKVTCPQEHFVNSEKYEQPLSNYQSSFEVLIVVKAI